MALTHKPSTTRSTVTAGEIAELPDFSPRMMTIPGGVETNAAFQRWWDLVKKRLITIQDGNSSRMTQLSVSATGTFGTLQAQITTEVSARISGDTALASSISTLSSTVSSNYTTLNAAITTEASTRASADSAEAATRASADATLQTNINTVSASVTTETNARVSADTALASSITTVSASVATETADRISADGTLQTNINTVSASVTTEATARATADGFLAGKYTLTVTAGDVVTGMNITSSSGSGTNISDVTFVASNFKIYNGTTGIAMFTVSGSNVNLANTLTVSTSGKVFTGTGTYANANTPFYVDTTTFSLGSNLTWNSATSTLTITGAITATTGSVGGFSIGADYIRDTADSFGLASTVTGGDDIRFWAGDTFANRAAAPFRLYESGAMYLTTLTGTGPANNELTITTPVVVMGVYGTGNLCILEMRGSANANRGPYINYMRDGTAAAQVGIHSGLFGGTSSDFSFYCAANNWRVYAGGVADVLYVTGTGVNATNIGVTTPGTGAFSILSASGVITSTLATGTAPFTVASTTVVANLNVSQLLGGTWAIPGAIGVTTPAAGSFTALAASGTITSTITGAVLFNNTATTQNVYVRFQNTGGNLYFGKESSAGSSLISGSAAYAAIFGNESNYPVQFAVNNAIVGSFISTGLAVTGNITVTAPIRLKNYTVATLPAGTQGDTAYVTDALAPAFLAVIVGGGAVVTPVFYNGAAWVGY